MSTYTKIKFNNALAGGITAQKLNLLVDDLSTAIAAGGVPGAGDMTKAVYDTNGNGKVDTCDSLPWGSVTGKPAAFPPNAHAPAHLDDGIDPIPVVTTARTGLAPKLSGDPATYLNGNGVFSVVVGGGGTPSSGISIWGETPAGTINGTNKNFTTAYSYAAGQLAVYVNGVRQRRTDDYSETGVSTFQLVSAPLTGDLLSVDYITGVTPGAWTNVTLGSGWTAPTQAQYRIEINGAVSTVYFRGMVQAAYSGLGTTAFTVPVGAQPSMTRACVLGGMQNTGTATDVASYIASVSSAGVCTVYPLTAGPFIWFDPSQVQLVYLDGLTYSL